METNEIMETTEAAVDTATEGTVGFEPNTLGKVLIGGLATLVVGGIGLLIGKACKKRKAIKEEQKLLEAAEAEEDVVEEIE